MHTTVTLVAAVHTSDNAVMADDYARTYVNVDCIEAVTVHVIDDTKCIVMLSSVSKLIARSSINETMVLIRNAMSERSVRWENK